MKTRTPNASRAAKTVRSAADEGLKTARERDLLWSTDLLEARGMPFLPCGSERCFLAVPFALHAGSE